MIRHNDFWIQYDYQIRTFRGEKDGVVHGVYEDEFTDIDSICSVMGVSVSDEEKVELSFEKESGSG